jgi:hypothetical protein
MIVPKYVMIPSSVYSAPNVDPYSGKMVVRRKSLVSGSPKPADKKVVAPNTAAHVVATTASSSAGGTGWTILSTSDAWDSSRRVTEFLEGLKIGKSIEKVTPLFLLKPQSLNTFHLFMIALSYSPGYTPDNCPRSLVRGEIRLICRRQGFS